MTKLATETQSHRERLATNFTERPSRNQIKKPITCTCTSTTTCTYFVDVDVHVLVDACCHLQICFQKVKDFRPSNTNYTKTSARFVQSFAHDTHRRL